MKILLNLFCVLLVFGLFTSCDDSDRFEALDATVVNPCLGTGFSGVAHILDGEPPENVAFPTNDNKDIIESTYLN